MKTISKNEIRRSLLPAFFFLLILVLLVAFFKYHTLPLGILLLTMTVISILMMMNRNLSQGYDIKFYKGEQERLSLLEKGKDGASEYIQAEKSIIHQMISSEFLTYAKLNLSTGYIYNAQPKYALETLQELNFEELTPPLRAIYGINLTDAYIQLADSAKAKEAKKIACRYSQQADKPRLEGMYHMLEMRYGVFISQYQDVLEKSEALPENYTDLIGQNLLCILRAICLKQTGNESKAREIICTLPNDKLLPNMTKLMEQYRLL